MREKLYKKFEDHFAGKEVTFYDKEIEHRDRLLMIIELKIKSIWLTDRKIFQKVKKKYDVSYPTILQDICIVQRMMANQKDPTGDPMKVWIRYFIEEVTKEAISKAREKGDAYTMAYSANIMGKHHLTDKEDVIKPNYEEIVPFAPELTLDPKVIGIELPENFEETREKYRKKYEEEYQRFVQKMTIPDAEIIEEDEE
jgi:hypothetical protein